MPNNPYSKIFSFFNHVHFHLDESHSLYLTSTLKTFAESLIGVFIPIFIFTLDNKPQIHSNILLSNIIWVLIFYLVRSTTVLIIIPSMINLVFSKLNFKMSIFVSGITLALALVFISLAQFNYAFLFVAAILMSFDTILYWIPYHILFIRKAASADGKFGKNSGIRFFLNRAASALGPVIGGIIVATAGFTSLFTIGVILIIVSAFPILFSIHEHKHKPHNAIKIFLNYFKKRSQIPYTLAFSSMSTESALYGIFWPVLLLITIESFTKVGLISSVSLAFSAIASIQVGKFIDKHGEKTVHKIGITINSILYIPRAFIVNPLFMYGIDIADRLNSTIYGIPFNAVMYRHARECKHDSEFIIFRNIMVHLGIVVAILVVTFLIFVFNSWMNMLTNSH